MSKHLIIALIAAAGLAGCESGDKDRGRTTSATTTRTSDSSDRPAYQTATARDMRQGWVPGRPPSATTSTNLARAEAQTGVRMDTVSRDEGVSVRTAAYTGGRADQGARVMTTAAPAPRGTISGEAFIRESLTGDIFEVESSKLAAERATDERLRRFAQMMVEHHSQAYDKLVEAADVQGIDAPDRPSQRQAALLERLAGLEGPQFDLEYSEAQVEAHQRAVKLHEHFLRSGSNPQLQAQAEERLGIIRGHLDEIRPIADDLYLTTLRQNGLEGRGQEGVQRPRDPQRPMDHGRPMDRGTQPDRPRPAREGSGLPPPMRRDTPGMTPGQQPGPTGPDRPQSQPSGEPDPR